MKAHLRMCVFVHVAVASMFLVGAGRAKIVTSAAGFTGPDSVITFETGTTALPGVPGVTLSSNADATFSTTLFGQQVYGNLSTAGGYTDLFALFSPPITEVGAFGRQFLGGGGPTQLHVNVYDTSNNLLEGSTLSTISQSPSFVGFVEPQGISKIEWLGGNAGFFAVDNVTFGGPAVPEPATIGVLCLVAIACKRLRVPRRPSLR